MDNWPDPSFSGTESLMRRIKLASNIALFFESNFESNTKSGSTMAGSGQDEYPPLVKWKYQRGLISFNDSKV